MPLNQKGSRVFAGTGSGYTESYLKASLPQKKARSPAERKAIKKFQKNRKRHEVTARAAFKLRSPRI